MAPRKQFALPLVLVQNSGQDVAFLIMERTLDCLSRAEGGQPCPCCPGFLGLWYWPAMKMDTYLSPPGEWRHADE